MAPRIPRLRKAVTENHQWLAAGFGEVNANAIRPNRTMSDIDSGDSCQASAVYLFAI
jgi:hypothetical protein